MKFFALAVTAGLCLAAAPAFAQAQAPASPPATPPAVTATPDTGKDGKPSATSVRKQCRASVKSEGLKGDEREKAVSTCFIKQRPDLAKRETARIDCGAEAKAKSLTKDAHRSFMKSCIKSKLLPSV